MKLLLDECTPRRLRRDLFGHDVSTIEEAGFKGMKNGALLKAASEHFDVLVTVDKSIPNQQNLAAFGIAVLILRAKTNKYPDLKLLVPRALFALAQIQPGDVVIITN
ncbi:MAG: DUF5615 family PIN-like protein [Blastocatellia bacterium]